jgi:ubiquinone/menaquinone biosynthesis C-methylase UbiE
MTASSEDRASGRTRARYDRNAWVYDLAEFWIERLLYRRWRRRLWLQVPAGRGLEVGVGTGRNMPHYPSGAHITAIDLSPRMLERARRRARRLTVDVELAEMSVEQLDFPDDTFDWAVATFVFCSVPDPVRGLKEVARVVKPGGQVLLLEHLRVDKPVIGRLMDLYNPLAVRITGANINRRTVENLGRSGLKVRGVTDLVPLGMFKLITAGP